MASNEQWKSGGNCSICRRKGFCKKVCSAHGRSLQGLVLREFANTRIGMTMLSVTAMLEHPLVNTRLERRDNDD